MGVKGGPKPNHSEPYPKRNVETQRASLGWHRNRHRLVDGVSNGRVVKEIAHPHDAFDLIDCLRRIRISHGCPSIQNSGQVMGRSPLLARASWCAYRIGGICRESTSYKALAASCVFLRVLGHKSSHCEPCALWTVKT